MSDTHHARKHRLKGRIRCDGCKKFTPLNTRKCVHCGKDQYGS